MERPASSSHKNQTTTTNTTTTTTDRAWTEQEDEKLLHHIQTHGHASWQTLPKLAGLDRSWKSCRLRWTNYVRPDLKSGNFGEDEEDLIIKLHALLGNRWSLIAGRLPGRTDVEVQNYWNSHITAKLINMGIDPQNHRVHQIRTIHDVRQHHVHQSKSKESDDDEQDEVSDAESNS